jgi:hypothetical protein
MPDVSRLDAFAKERRLRYRWRTWREGEHWHAEARAWKGETTVGWYSSSGTSSEQIVLDYVIDLLIAGPPDTTCGPNRRRP